MPSKYVLKNNTIQNGTHAHTNAGFRDSEPDGINIEIYQNVGKVDVDRKHGSSFSTASESSKGGKKKKEKPNIVGMREIFRFATGKDKLLMIMGTLAAAAQGSALPIVMVVFGTMTDSFVESGTFYKNLDIWMPIWQETCRNMTLGTPPPSPCDNITSDYILDDPNPPTRFVTLCKKLDYPIGCESMNATNPEEMKTLLEQMGVYSIYYVIIGICVIFVGYLQVLGWQTAAYNQSQRVRTKLFWSILRMEIGWFDTHEVGELNTRISDDVAKFESGIGDKLGMFFQFTSTFVAGIIVGFAFSWKLAAVILAVSPLLALSGFFMSRVGAAMTSKEVYSYAKAGAIAEEAFGAIRTVVAFGGQEKECERYTNNLHEAKHFGIKKGTLNGLAMGMIFFFMFSSYGLAYWYGSKLVFDGEISPGTILTVFFAVLTGTFSLGNAAPNIQDFGTARGAASALFNIIDRVPTIDSSSPAGRKEKNMTGNVEFRNIHFNYPSRSDVKVLQGLNMKIQVGQTVALVGPSGCGKSTTVQLLQRFYDPEVGQILMDGIDIRDFNIKWLRQQIGVVSQEPVLFATTIAENIRYGNDDVTDDDIIRACKEANAHDFVSKLPKQYETLVGERGAQLSGGQKQRIAIARALVRNPKILLLDEATSALDTESEATVQAALDKVRTGRTTMVIAHRLSTIRTADVIVSLQDGVVTEQGTHEELMARQGLYYELVMNQQQFFVSEHETIDITEKPDFLRETSVISNGRTRTMSGLSKDARSRTDTQLSTKDEEEKLPAPSMKRIIKLNKPEMPLIVIGCIFAIIVGGVQPTVAVLFTEILGVFSETYSDEIQDKVDLYSGMFVVVGVVAFISLAIMGVTFAKSGENLTMRLRSLSFNMILRQEMSYFDDHGNSVGALCTRLATDASAVQGATGAALSTFARSVSSIGTGIIIGFIFSWQLTLLIIGFAPLLLIAGYVQMKVRSGSSSINKQGLENAGKTAIEAIESIRTVATLTKEQLFYDLYVTETEPPIRIKKKQTHIQGFAYSISQSMMFFAIAAAFSLGAFLVQNQMLQYNHMFRVFSAIMFSAMSAGQASSFAPDYGKAKLSSAKIFQLLDKKPAIDSADPSGKKVPDCKGHVTLTNIYFNYPSRPDVPVLQGLNLTVNPGQTVALVGSSGCGKSTTVQLLERFYDPREGQVTIEGHDIVDLNLQWLRSQIGLVSQEPMLFDASIRDNIAYGDNSRQVPMTEIIEAARNANIHSFIDSLPGGYDTNAGDKGTQLSGGQKQRIAIARALVRNPKILLLDEATSALDTESEKIVQAALDRAQEGRTCIVIAHRLSTIHNADCIVVIHQGHVVEMGTHSELMKLKGKYYTLNNTQKTKKR